MLQYALIFESILFTFTIIYITFLFSLGPLPLSPHLLFLPSISSSPSLKCISSLSLTSFLCSLSLSLYSTSLPPSPTKLRPEHQATPRHATSHELDLHSQIAIHQHSHTTRRNSGRSIKPRHATPHEPDLHSQIAVHQHSHTNPIYTLRSPSTNTAT